MRGGSGAPKAARVSHLLADGEVVQGREVTGPRCLCSRRACTHARIRTLTLHRWYFLFIVIRLKKSCLERPEKVIEIERLCYAERIEVVVRYVRIRMQHMSKEIRL